MGELGEDAAEAVPALTAALDDPRIRLSATYALGAQNKATSDTQAVEQDTPSSGLSEGPVVEIPDVEEPTSATIQPREHPQELVQPATSTDTLPAAGKPDAELVQELEQFSGSAWNKVASTGQDLTEDQVRSLELMGSRVTDQGVKELASLTQLHWLGLAGTQVTKA